MEWFLPMPQACKACLGMPEHRPNGLASALGGLVSQANPGGAEGGGIFAVLVPFGLMFLLLYFIMIRPQRKKEQEKLKMLANIKRNDHVLTSGGIYGIVTALKDNEVSLKIDEDSNVKMRVAKSAIVGIEKSSPAGPPSE